MLLVRRTLEHAAAFARPRRQTPTLRIQTNVGTFCFFLRPCPQCCVVHDGRNDALTCWDVVTIKHCKFGGADSIVCLQAGNSQFVDFRKLESNDVGFPVAFNRCIGCGLVVSFGKFRPIGGTERRFWLVSIARCRRLARAFAATGNNGLGCRRRVQRSVERMQPAKSNRRQVQRRRRRPVRGAAVATARAFDCGIFHPCRRIWDASPILVFVVDFESVGVKRLIGEQPPRGLIGRPAFEFAFRSVLPPSMAYPICCLTCSGS